MFQVAVYTISDSGFQGKREDTSGPLIVSLLKEYGYDIIHTEILPDVQETIERALCHAADHQSVDLVLTTGGTGFSPRDVTPEATLSVSEKAVPGIPEAMRALSAKVTNRAMLSRAAAGIRKQTLIVNLPGSPKAVEECLSFILEPLHHGLEILTEHSKDCGRK